MRADSKTETEVMAALNQFSQAYDHRDIQGVLSSFVPDSDVVLIGTGADEKRIGTAEIKKQAERDWSQSEASSLSWRWHLVSMAGPVACLAAEGSLEAKVGGQRITMPLRLTAALEHRGDKWLFEQAHFSTPSMEQAEGESFPTGH